MTSFGSQVAAMEARFEEAVREEVQSGTEHLRREAESMLEEKQREGEAMEALERELEEANAQ
eukprot:3804114-Pyramimonas_sp.AAC.1